MFNNSEWQFKRIFCGNGTPKKVTESPDKMFACFRKHNDLGDVGFDTRWKRTKNAQRHRQLSCHGSDGPVKTPNS
jgi:hypothetical protein